MVDTTKHAKSLKEKSTGTVKARSTGAHPTGSIFRVFDEDTGEDMALDLEVGQS